MGTFRPCALLIACLVAAAAQEPPKFELFGGYSNLWLTGSQPYLPQPSHTAWNSGWEVSAKLNLTPRIGLLADFSSHYGTFTMRPSTRWAGTDHEVRFDPTPGDMRIHSFLLGPEIRVLRRHRFTVNARALLGVSHTNEAILPLRQPVQWPVELFGQLPPVTKQTYPSSTAFAASIGGSVDYRITSRWSIRILQPELLFIRSLPQGSSPVNHSNLRLSSGVVFTPGRLSNDLAAPRFSFGVLGGAALTDAFGHESTGFFALPGGTQQVTRSRSYSTLKDYVLGPAIEAGLPWHGLSVELDALYRPMNLTMAGVGSDGSLNSISPATVVTWEFPVLAKYRFALGPVVPFLEAGPSFRTSGNLNDASPSTYGATAGLGVEAHLGKLKAGPVLRYTHWAADDNSAGSRSKRNQLELLLGVSF